MKFHYHGDLTPGNSVSFGIRTSAELTEDMEFAVEDDDTALRLAGMDDVPFEPVVNADTPYRVLQKVASKRDDVSGNLPEDELRAALTGGPVDSDESESDDSDDEPEDATSNEGA